MLFSSSAVSWEDSFWPSSVSPKHGSFQQSLLVRRLRQMQQPPLTRWLGHQSGHPPTCCRVVVWWVANKIFIWGYVVGFPPPCKSTCFHNCGNMDISFVLCTYTITSTTAIPFSTAITSATAVLAATTITYSIPAAVVPAAIILAAIVMPALVMPALITPALITPTLVTPDLIMPPLVTTATIKNMLFAQCCPVRTCGTYCLQRWNESLSSARVPFLMPRSETLPHGGRDDSILSAKLIRIAPETSSF